jgi:hypothetical protein
MSASTPKRTVVEYDNVERFVLDKVIWPSQGFRNKVFVIEIPRELGRSSFNICSCAGK